MQLQSIVPGEKSNPRRRDGSGMFGHPATLPAADTTLEFGRFRLLTRAGSCSPMVHRSDLALAPSMS